MSLKDKREIELCYYYYVYICMHKIMQKYTYCSYVNLDQGIYYMRINVCIKYFVFFVMKPITAVFSPCRVSELHHAGLLNPLCVWLYLTLIIFMLWSWCQKYSFIHHFQTTWSHRYYALHIYRPVWSATLSPPIWK